MIHFNSSPVSPELQSSTVSIFLYSLAAYLMLIRVAQPHNLIHKILIVGCGALYVGGAFLFANEFDLHPLKLGAILILTALMLLTYPIDTVIQKIFNNFGPWMRKIGGFFAKGFDKGTNKEITEEK